MMHMQKLLRGRSDIYHLWGCPKTINVLHVFPFRVCFQAGVAAHAFGPGEYAISGDVHLDEEEDWTLSVNRKDGTNLLAVLIHEIGHALGLSHSKDPTSVMHPAFVSAKLDLNVDDIENVQILYGE